MIISKNTSETYEWGSTCQGWHLVNNKKLSIIQEIMPPGTSEVIHKHTESQQFFFVLKGKAIFIIENKRFEVSINEGIYIRPNYFHQIKNETKEPLEFLVISQPHAHGDRII
ncbi:cupin domain-containing protein [Aquimarina sp. ERC-38]|uniref:cupin domain-containing protein n=1 Tax=Aquimarina sp. ERC-38 TaxID=2949996 RepID=UPI00224609C4|nr:cupin domain-containing protein [Aquimarina sp. ERC-38]UZO80591.1 cupin domain-containing protein [Aquimarina sp. ERC-38]